MTINKVRTKSANLNQESKLKTFSGEDHNFCRNSRICTGLSGHDPDQTTTSKVETEIWQLSCKSVCLLQRKLPSKRRVLAQFLKKKMWLRIYPRLKPNAEFTKLIWWKKLQPIFLQVWCNVWKKP